MALFLSQYQNRIDKKGRVSVPAPFRAVLAGQAFQGIIAYRSFINPCVEACGMSRMEALYAGIDALDPFSPERDAFATALLGESEQLAFDGDGRVILPEHLLQQAQLQDTALFVGKGATFEIWAPERYHTHAEAARKLAMEQRSRLRLTPTAHGGGTV